MPHPLDQVPCICLNCTGQGLITWVNHALCKKTGYAAEEVVGRNLSELVTLGTRIFLQTHFFPLIQLHGHAEEIFITLRSKEGADLPVIINTLRHDEGGEFSIAGLLVHNRNRYEQEIIAAKKYAEQALAENKELITAKAQLQQHAAELDSRLFLLQQQNKDLRQLSFSLTHTLQEPLRKLAVFSSVLLEQKVPEPAMVKKINALARHYRQLIAQLQHYLNIGLEQVAFVPIDLLQLLNKVAETYRGQGHEVHLPVQHLPLIEGHLPALTDLFGQLLSNAVRFRQPGKNAAIRIEAVSLQANAFRALPSNYHYKNYLRVSVADEGIGFGQEHADKIFSLFTKFQPGTEGYGMGLAICKKIMEWHNGSITADGTPGKGAVISCFFPLTDDAST